MIPYQFTAKASQNNAFGWMNGEPSIFASSQDRAISARKAGQMTADGQRIIGAAASMLGRLLDKPAHIKAKVGPHHKGPRKAKP